MHSDINQLLHESFADNRLDTDEKHDLYHLLLTLKSEDKRFLRKQSFDFAGEKIQQGA
jgi:hypothetical protein